MKIYYYSSGSIFDGSVPVKLWYREIKDYNFKKATSYSEEDVIGHFTQVVWKSSSRLGVGLARNADGGTYVVANYDKGNVIGAFKANVSPPIINNNLI